MNVTNKFVYFLTFFIICEKLLNFQERVLEFMIELDVIVYIDIIPILALNEYMFIKNELQIQGIYFVYLSLKNLL